MLNRTTTGYIHIYEYTQRKYAQRKYIQRKYTQREYAQIRIRMKNSMELLCNYDIINVTVINNQ